MARVDLVDAGVTLRGRGQRARGKATFQAESGSGGRSRRSDSATFSIPHLDLTVPDGKTMVVLGPSGCGKSTLLRMIAGLIPLDSGEVRYDGVPVDDVPPGERQIGMVFQNFSLYPNRTSRDNVRSYFWLRKRTPQLSAMEKAKLQRTSALMGVELTHLLDRMPRTLSGGEQQRVAIGRCITRDARLLLMDEPFSNLDQALRERYRANLKTLLQEYSVTTVYVTHDHQEAVLLADLIAVMDHGRIEQVGTAGEIYDEPRTAFVAEFLSLGVGGASISFLEPDHLARAHDLGDVRVGVRPEDVEVVRHPQPGGVEGTVVAVLDLPLRGAALLTVRVGSTDVSVGPIEHVECANGDRVWLLLRRVHLFDAATGTRVRTITDPPG